MRTQIDVALVLNNAHLNAHASKASPEARARSPRHRKHPHQGFRLHPRRVARPREEEGQQKRRVAFHSGCESDPTPHSRTVNATLDKKDADAIRRLLVERLLKENRESLSLLSPAQVSGLIDVNAKTLADIKDLPRVTIIPGKIYRYRLADVKAWIERNRA